MNDKAALVAFLTSLPFLNNSAIGRISESFALKELRRRELFLQERKIANEYLFLEQGFIRSYLFDTEGNEVTINFYGPNEMVFEVASFFKRIPSEENFQAITACRGWVLTFEQLNQLFHALPEFREMGRAMLVKGFVAFKERTIALINKSAEERYAILMQRNPEILQHASLKHIASYLGITDSSLSRIRKNFSGK